MKVFVLGVFLFLALNFLAINVFAKAPLEECQSIRYSPNIDYCIYNMRSKNPDVIYYFHHAGGTETSWRNQKETFQFYRELRKNNIEKPTVISISLGRFWLMTDMPRKNRTNLQDFFTESMIPYFENKLEAMKKTPVRNRYLFGVSMGGYNALVLTLRRPELFTKVAIACPALPLISHFSTQEEINDYVLRTGADARIVPFILKIMRKEFETPEDIHRNNPFELLETIGHDLPPIYITVGDKDEFGIFETVRRLAALLTLKASELIFKPIANGGHCSMDTSEVVQFLKK